MRSMMLGALALALAACATTKSQTPAAATAQKEGSCPVDGPHTGMQPHTDDAAGAVKAFDHQPKPGEKAVCPVSGETFVVTAETKTAQHDGKWYAFCCDDCAPDFAKDPAKYTAQ